MPDAARGQARMNVLRRLGADEGLAAELLEYNTAGCAPDQLERLELPLADEPHLAIWDEYEQDAQRDGVFAALRARLVQLRFPIAEGISQSEDYRAATRRGVFPPPEAAGLALKAPEALQMRIHPTLAGRIPILVVPVREDFEALVRALSSRNEPEAVPTSMGACIVAGLNNWDRVQRHRREIEAARGGPLDESAWSEAFRALVPRKELYQDRLILLSKGPYSAVPASRMGLGEEEWLERSLELRREHECTHYFTRRALGFMRNNAFDEILADFAGLVAAFGRYDPRPALLFLGLEEHPRYRSGGRLESYLGQPRLSPGAEEILRTLVVEAIKNLARLAEPLGQGAPRELLPRLATLTLEELSSGDLLEERIGERPPR